MNKNCPDDKILNPTTNRCVSKDGAIGKKLIKASSASVAVPKKKEECPDDKILNPATNRCVSKDGAIGKKLIKAPVSTPAPALVSVAPLDIITNNIDDNDCNDVITIPQHQNTCWFTALLMSLFYSQYSRELLLKKPFNTNTTVKKILNNILIDHYIDNDNYLNFFKKLNLHDLLKYFISQERIVKMIIKRGFNVAAFIPYFMNVIDKSFIMLNKFDNINNEVYGGYMNNYFIPYLLTKKESKFNKEVINKELNQSPDYIFLTIFPKSHDLSIMNEYNLKNYPNIKYDDINELKDVIKYNGHTYILDSCILNNFNKNKKIPGHSIAGIKCKNKKFVYNGWIKSTKDPAMLQNGIQHIPCKLMKFDWDIKKDNDFCINGEKCDLVKSSGISKNICFSFNKGYRTLIYVKQLSTVAAPAPAPSPVKPTPTPVKSSSAPIDIITNNLDDNECNDVITIPQHQNTCWFTAFLMSMFYSQYSRELLLNKPFKTDTIVKKVLNDILIDHYLDNDKYLNFFKNLNLHDLLKHFINNEILINHIIKNGFNMIVFTPFFMKVIDKSFIMLNKFDDIKNEIYGNYISNFFNPFYITKKEPSLSKDTLSNELNQSPDYIFLTIFEENLIDDKIDIFNLKNYSNIKYKGINELNDVIEYNGHTYNLDSCNINNFNARNTIGDYMIPAHGITGIKCKNKKFVYNGWISSSKDPAMLQSGVQHIPCKLMKFDWDVKKNNEFCLNAAQCKLDIASRYNLCFSFNKGNRTIIYVKQQSAPVPAPVPIPAPVPAPVPIPAPAPAPAPKQHKPLKPHLDDDFLSKEEKELLKNLPSYISPSYIYNTDRIVDFMTNDTSYSLNSKIHELTNMLNDLNDIDYEVSMDISTRTKKQQEKAQAFIKYNNNRISKIQPLLKKLIIKNDKIMSQASRRF